MNLPHIEFEYARAKHFLYDVVIARHRGTQGSTIFVKFSRL